jgi:hypothetical protein
MKRPATRLTRTAGLAAVLLSLACYKYTYVQPGEAAVGNEVRVHLSESGYTHVSEAVGPAVPRFERTFDGVVVHSDSAKLLISTRIWTEGASPRDWLEQRVAVPATAIAQLQLKQLNMRKVTLLGVGAGVVVGAILVGWLSGEFGGTTDAGGDPTPSELARPGWPR